MVVQRLDATVQEHVIVTRRPHVRPLAVIQFSVHVDIDVLIPRELLHQRRQGAQCCRFGAPETVDHNNRAILILLVRVDHQLW